MGGIPIHVTAWDVEPDAFRAFVEEYRAEVQRWESLLSVHRTESWISRLNRAEGASMEVDPAVSVLLRDAVAWSAETKGAFDPTVGPLVSLWKRAAARGSVPTPEEIAAARRVVGAEKVDFRRGPDDGARVSLPAGGALDLGGVAKGWFADRGIRTMRARGFRRGLIELGGDLFAFDDRNLPVSFRIGVRDPERTDRMLGVLHFAGGGVVTSGDYERGYEVAGRRYAHVIDPRTGVPVEGIRSVTLMAESGARADALATGVMVLGEREGLALVESLPGVEAILVVADATAPGGRRLIASSGLADRFEAAPPVKDGGP
jgi:thiamine biosynthesis lipoprotein